MRILHVSDCFLPRAGGIEVTVSDLSRQQAAAGHDVRLITLTVERSSGAPESDVRTRDAWVTDQSGVAVRRPRSARLPDRLRLIRAAQKEAASGSYDVVHAHASTFSPLAFAIALGTKRRRRPVGTIITIHSLWRYYTVLYRIADLLLGWSRLPMVWSAVSRCAADSVSRAARTRLIVPVLSNGLDLQTWPRPDRHVPSEGVRLISVMRLAARKRPRALVRTLRRAHRILGPGHGMTMTIVGDGPQRQHLERYLQRHHMTDWVEVTGHLPRAEVAEHLRRADVFLAPASLESFGIAALEAHAAGLPVIGRLGTGLADYVRDGIDGRLVDSDRAMAAAIVELVRAREQGETWWVEQPAVDQFSWAEVMNRAEELYAHAGRLVHGAAPERAPAR